MTDLYMHTMDGKPAEYQPSTDTVVFSGRRVTRFATSLAQIKREQKSSIAVYGDPPDSAQYGYVRIARSAVSET